MRRFPGKWNSREKRLQGGMLLSYLSNRTIGGKDETFLGENFGEKLLGLWFASLFFFRKGACVILRDQIKCIHTLAHLYQDDENGCSALARWHFSKNRILSPSLPMVL